MKRSRSQDGAGMEDLWKEVFPVGTEWEMYDKVYEVDWRFSSLEKSFEQGEVLHKKKAYLFGCTEPQQVTVQGNRVIVYVPVVVAVTLPFPPSNKIGVTSVQMAGEMILPMKDMKMNWVPYVPEGVALESYRSDIFTLKCNQRRVALKHLKEDRVKRFQYCLPYFYNPFKEEDELEMETVISLMYPMSDDAPPLIREFDCEFDDIDEFTCSLVQEQSLPEAESDKFKEFVKEQKKHFRQKRREAKLAKEKAKEAMSASLQDLKDMKVYKFYPGSSLVEGIQRSNYVNRYYGKANDVL